MWFAETNGNPAVVKMTPSGACSELRIPENDIPQAYPLAVAGVRDGSLWFTLDDFGQLIGQVTVDGSFTERSAL